MIILGIDPGTTAMGFAVIHEQGGALKPITYGTTAISAPTLAEKLTVLEQTVADLIAAHRPDGAGIEKLFFAKNKKTALAVAQARGVILATLQRNNLPIIELAPVEVKMAVTNYGAADKQMVAKMVTHLLGLTRIDGDDNAADALAIAIAAASALQTQKRLDAAQ